MAKNGEKLYYLYYWNGDECWHLFKSPSGGAGVKQLKDLFCPAMTAIKCRGAENILYVSLPNDKKAPVRLPKQLGANPSKKDLDTIGLVRCRKPNLGF